MWRIKNIIKKFWADESGVGVVEIILILVVNLTPQNRVWIA